MAVKSCYMRNHKQQAPVQIYRQGNIDNALIPVNELQTQCFPEHCWSRYFFLAIK